MLFIKIVSKKRSKHEVKNVIYQFAIKAASIAVELVVQTSPPKQIWVPQFKHSALTPPGAKFPKVFPVPCNNKAGFKLVTVALGPDKRVVAAVWV